MCYPVIRRKHPYFLLKHFAHIFGIRVSHKSCDLVQFQLCGHQKLFNLPDPYFLDQNGKRTAGFFLDLAAQILL